MKRMIFLPALIAFFFTKTSFAQNQTPTADECASLYPCKAPGARPHRRHRTAPAKTAVTDPDVLRRLDVLETQANAIPLVQAAPACECEHSCPTPPPPAATVVENHITAATPRANDARFGLELGGLASVHSSWWETSPGFYGAMRLRMGRVALGVESGYQRTAFADGSTVEDVYVGPTLGYVSGSRKVRLTLTGSLGFWTTLEDWITPICGRSACDGENENALTISAEPGLIMTAVKNLEFSLGLPVRWISKMPDGDEWTLGIRAGLGVYYLP